MSGTASHKDSSAKPNNNQNGLIDSDPTGVPTEADYSRDDQDVTPVNADAIERPENKLEVEQK